MRRDNHLFRILLWGATLLSFGSTAFGLFAWFRSETDLLQAIGFAVVWSAFLQAGIILFWSHVGRSVNGVGRVLAVVIAVFCSLASMTFGSTIWLMRTGKTDFERTLTRANAGLLIDPIISFSKQTHEVAITMANVAATAANKAEIEGSVGGTCEGLKPVRDCGPICRMRQRHQTEALKLRDELGAMAQASIDITSSIQADLSRQGLKQGYTQALALARHQSLSNARGWLDAQTHGFDTKFVDPQTGVSFTCKDPIFRDQLAAARKALDADLSLPNLPPEPATVGYSDAATKSVKDIVLLVRSLATLSVTPEIMDSLRDSSIGLGIAGFIELVIIFLVLAEAHDLKRRGALETPAEGFIFTKRRMPAEQIERLAQLGYYVDRFTYRTNTLPHAFFLRPMDGRPDTVRKCSDIVRLFDLPFIKGQVKMVHRDIVADWAILNDDLTNGAQTFEVRLLTRELDKQLRIIARDALLLPARASNDNPAVVSTGKALVAHA